MYGTFCQNLTGETKPPLGGWVGVGGSLSLTGAGGHGPAAGSDPRAALPEVDVPEGDAGVGLELGGDCIPSR